MKITNHHLRQNKTGIEICNLVPRILTHDANRSKYYSRSDEERSVNHWGQRKLLLSEIEFLTMYYDSAKLVVYAGAAPGTHTSYLSELFPKLEFHLWDPAPFTCKRSKKIKIFRDFFTDDVAKSYASKDSVLFISDIRTADPKVLSGIEVEEAIKFDQKLQMDAHLLMNPVASMLKFRLPWNSTGNTEYLDGKIFLPVWGRQSTTETRLVVERGADMKLYNDLEYEEQMFYFNTVTRVQYYQHDVEKVPGLCHCYDCASEVYILTKYLKIVKNVKLYDAILNRVQIMSLFMNKKCSTKNRTLEFVEDYKKISKVFRPRKYKDKEGKNVLTYA